VGQPHASVGTERPARCVAAAHPDPGGHRRPALRRRRQRRDLVRLQLRRLPDLQHHPAGHLLRRGHGLRARRRAAGRRL